MGQGLVKMRDNKGFPLLVLLLGVICICMGIMVIGFGFIPALIGAKSTPSTAAGVPTLSHTSTAMDRTVPPTAEGPKPSPAPWDRTKSSILLLERLATGEIWYSLLDSAGNLIREIDSPPTSSRMELIEETDISPDGNFLVVGPNKTYYMYKNTHGVSSIDYILYLDGLSTGQIQYTLPLLQSSSGLLSGIRDAVIVPYDEKMYGLLDDPEAAYQSDMETNVSNAWDAYIEGLGSRDWSLDGTQLAFTSQTDGVTTALRILDVQTGSIKTLVEKPLVFSSPQWSPDGKWILVHQYEVGNLLFGAWYAYSADGKTSILVKEIGDYSEQIKWLDEHTIMDISSGVTSQMYVFDILTGKDQLFFDKPIGRFAIARDGTFAAISETEKSGSTNIWYCPFDGEERVLLDSFVVPENTYLMKLLAFTPDRIFVEFVNSSPGSERSIYLWRYIPGSEKQVIGEHLSIYAVSPNGQLVAYYDLAGEELVIRDSNGEIGRIPSDKPERLLWDPRSELLLVQTSSGDKIIRANGEIVAAITLQTDTVEIIANWVI
jgi:hypothetical protein